MGSITQGRALLCAHPLGGTPSCSPLSIHRAGIGRALGRKIRKRTKARQQEVVHEGRETLGGREWGKEGRVVELFVDALSVWFLLSVYCPCSLSLPSVDRIIQLKFRSRDPKGRK